jgi:DNA invertase Pin-like site-specific DNA recombinase
MIFKEKSMKKVAMYCRVSTKSQQTLNQELELQALAQRMCYEIVTQYKDEGISGAKNRDERPGLALMMKDAVRGKFDGVLIYDLSRLGRNLEELVSILNEMNSLNINLFFYREAINTETSSGKMMFSMFGVLAEWERNLIAERIVSGQNRARTQGKKIGRPSTFNDGLKQAVRKMREKGMGIVAISKTLGCGVSSVYKSLSTT